ncbi:MAG TPA: GNAT family N-acetyltransferase, partial [Polyangiaceae bacterium]|nr:GNAT family N-acetyltransferase [Polyangiaceae bacterium]
MRFVELQESDVELLATWISGEVWPYHARARVDAGWFRDNSAQSFFGSGARSFWITAPDSAPLGVVRVFDLSDMTPLVDLRVAEAARGQGIGTVALGWIIRFVFETFAETQRLG